MWFDFFVQNFHFALLLLISLVFFAVSWLHLDSWKTTHAVRTLVKALGFLLLSLSFLTNSTLVESTLFFTIIPPQISFIVFFLLQATGLILIIFSPA